MSEQPEQNTDPDAVVKAELPIVAHLLELRSRVLKSVVAVLVIFLCLFYFANDIYTFISEPIRAYLPEGTSMIATEIASPFLTPFKLTIVLAIFISMPFTLHQVWSFISPGMYSREKRLAVPILVSSVLLFYTGMIFAYYVVFPLVFGFLTSMAPEGVNVMPDINQYLNFVLKLFFAFGMAFEIPVATFLLISSGVTSIESLTSKRPYIVVGCFVFGMLLTPPDVVSQALLAIPMWFLFEVGILLSRLNRKNRPKPESDTEEDDDNQEDNNSGETEEKN
ncbi:MAG: twin-arginine translocase subunit TatC [Pseudomonadales bacterium]